MDTKDELQKTESQETQTSNISPSGQANTPTNLQPSKSAAFNTIWKRLTGRTRAYLAEYAVVLIVLAALIALVNTFFAGIINSFDDQAGNWLSSWQYKLSLGQLAAVVAIVPLLTVLTKRTAGTEDDAPIVKESNWRKAFLGVFLIGIGLTAVGYVIGFVYVLVSLVANMGLAVDADSSPVLALITTAFGALLFGFSALLYARDYRAGGGLGAWRKIHRYGLVIVAVVLGVIFAAIPLQKQRGAYVDTLIVGDITSIKSKITSYKNDKRKLPVSLAEVDLSDEVKTRSESLNYEYKLASNKTSYELCATFKTDKSDKKESGITSTISALSSSGASATSESSSQQSPSKHKKGYQCFKTTVSLPSSRYMSGSSSSSSLRDLLRTNDSSYDDFDYDDNSL